MYFAWILCRKIMLRASVKCKMDFNYFGVDKMLFSTTPTRKAIR